MLQSIRSQGIGHDWVTELTEVNINCLYCEDSVVLSNVCLVQESFPVDRCQLVKAKTSAIRTSYRTWLARSKVEHCKRLKGCSSVALLFNMQKSFVF